MSKRTSRRPRIRPRTRDKKVRPLALEDIRKNFNKELEKLASDPYVPADIRKAILDANQDFFD